MASVIAALFFSGGFSANAFAGMSWNERHIQWYGYMDGLLEAKRQNKSVIIVVYAEWCGYCKRYAKMFQDPAIVSAMEKVVAIKLDADDPAGWANRYGLKGSGVPRTFALDKDNRFIRHPKRTRDNAFFSWTGNRAQLLNFINLVASK